jgi:hypothetical protein
MDENQNSLKNTLGSSNYIDISKKKILLVLRYFCMILKNNITIYF